MPLLVVNGEEREYGDDDFPQNLSSLVSSLNLAPDSLVAEVDGMVVQRQNFSETSLNPAVGSSWSSLSVEVEYMNDTLIIAGKKFNSRLFIGTGKFSSPDIMRQCLEASGTEMVTVALRRVEIGNPGDSILAAIDRERYQLLPNTSGARDAAEAVRVAQLARAASGIEWIKLEVTPDPHYLLPDPVETFKAAEELVKDGFIVLPYINADPVLAKRLQDVGTATVMPLGSPIGSNQGIQTRANLEIIIEQATVPVVVDAGLGLPSHAAEAMEMGADAVLVNTAIAVAGDPVAMAEAFSLSTRAGRQARLSGPGRVSPKANASSPLVGFLDEAANG